MSRIVYFRQRLSSRVATIEIYDLLALAAFAALAITVLTTFKDYAVTNDEWVQHRYGELILSYYASGFTDEAVFHFENLFLYGGLFDLVSVLLERVLPFDIFHIRHILCALIGIGGIVATWGVARLVAGTRAGLLALLALAVCGPWYGTMFNHTKDIPFAAAMMGATYFLLRGSRDLPRPKLFDIVMFGALLGCALGMRAGGLLMIGYAGLTVLLRLPGLASWKERAAFSGVSLVSALPAFGLAYVIMIAAWPWAALEPLNPVRAVFVFANFHYGIWTLAFGQTYEMFDVPRWYTPAYLAIKLPLTILCGALIALVMTVITAPRDGFLRNLRQLDVVMLAFIALFPVLCQVIGHGPAFTGLRHFIFVIPALAALAGIGFEALLTRLQLKHHLLAAGALAAVSAAFVGNTITLVRLHPYEYLFFNPLVSGLEGASRRFDMDYWSTIMPEAVKSLEAYLDQRDPKAKKPRPRYVVGFCGEKRSFEKETKKHPEWIWTDEWEDADFFISSTQMDCDKRMAGETIANIQRLGVTIGVVKDRRAIVRSTVSRNP